MLGLVRRWLPPLLVSIGLCVPLAAQAQVPISEAARAQFRAGVALLDDPGGPRYEEAYRAFGAAYALSPSPKILGNLGLCAMMLERDGEAIDAYRAYLREVPDIAPAEREHIERELGLLESSSVPLTLRIAPADATVIDERTPVQGAKVINRYTPEGGTLTTRIRAGQHRITVQREGHAPERWTFEASPLQPVTRAVRLTPLETAPPPAPAPPPERGSVWGEPPVVIGLVLSGALWTGTAVAAILAADTHGDYEDARRRGDAARGAALRDRGETLNLVADVLLASAAVATAATGALLLFWPDGDDADSAGLSILAAPGGAGLGVRW